MWRVDNRSKATSIVKLAVAAMLVVSVQATAQTISVNFQNETAQSTSDFLRDYGLPYGPRTLAEQVNGAQTYVYGWVAPGTTTPVNLTNQGRDRDSLHSGAPANPTEEELQRLDTLIHMDHPSTPPVGDWEIELPNGFYTVTVSVGDPLVGSSPELHTINVEGVNLISQFEPTGAAGAATRRTSASAVVQLSDGRLTLDDNGGTNTKPNYIVVEPAAAPTNPAVLATSPNDGDTGVAVDIASIAATDLVLPNGAIDAPTVTPSTVLLYPAGSPGSPVPSSVNTTGGGDAIVLTPTGDLDPFTTYTFEITSSVQDVTGATFVPFTMDFTTGAAGGGGGTAMFEKVSLSTSSNGYTQVNFGPDGRLYAATIGGSVLAWDVLPDGTLQNEELIATLSGRAIIGMVLDPQSTATEPVIWVTSNQGGLSSGPAFSGELVRIVGSAIGSGSDSWTVQTMVVGLPRSTKDHLSNSIVFGPNGERALYGTQGSNSAMGGADSTWGLRDERILTAAVYRTDLVLLEDYVTTNGMPLDVNTGTFGLGDPALPYDPQAVGAPVTLFATGMRNAYDLVWHSNGFLYVPTNGSAGGGGGTQANAPATPANFATLPQCQNRLDDAANGDYAGPAIPQVFPSTRDDLLFKVEAGGYYGHPNPTRCEWVLNGGNPTGGSDLVEVSNYPSGTLPDRNWRGIAFNFAKNKSPNGVIEYQSNTFGGALQGKLLVVRYSGGDDVFVMTPDGSGDIVATESLVDGGGQTINFNEPLDLTEDLGNGNLYVAEYTANTISLLRPLGSMPTSPELELSGAELIFDGVKNQTHGANVALTIGNAVSATDNLVITGLTLGGADAAGFVLQNAASYSFPITLTPGQTLSPSPDLLFTPGATVGTFEASLQIATNDGIGSVGLYGLSINGLEGGNEPPLQDVVDTLGYGIDVGWSTLTNTTSATLQGEEIDLPLFQKAGAGDVQMLPVARYSPLEPLPFGYYLPNGASPVLMPVGVLSGVTPQHQALFPALASGAISFDPGASTFGLYTTSVSHTAYTEDDLNASNQPSPDGHAVRVYPLRDRAGSLVPNAYLIGFEEAANGDYNDYVFVLSNVQPPSGPPDTTPPPVPSNLSASGQPGSILVSWDAVTDPDLAGYNVYRSTSSPVTTSGQPLNGASPIAATQYVDAVPPSVVYVYAVTAVDGSGNESILSNESSAAATAPTGNFAYYREVFPNTTGDDVNISTTGWAINTNGSPTPTASKGGGSPINVDGIFAGAALGLSATEQEFGFAAAFGGTAASQHHAFTSEQSIDRTVYEVTQISWTQGHAAASAQSRVAIEIGGQWYVSASTFSNAGGVTGTNFGTNAEAKSFAFTTAASAWQTFDAGTLTVGTTLAAPLPTGDISAFGLYSENAGGFTMRFDSYEVAVDVQTGGNVAPSISLVTDVSGGVSVGEGDTLDVEFTVTDPNGNLDTVTVTGADFISLSNVGDNYTATFAPQAPDSDFSYTIVITATDTDLASSTAQFNLAVFDPGVTPCAPLSTLPCAAIPVSLPFALGFTGGEGGLSDGDADATGFTMVDPPSNGPGPVPTAPGYAPANLNVAGGTLTIASTAGLQFETNANTQLNALGVGFDADGSGPLDINTTLVAVPNPVSEQFQQSGLWFGLDEDNYVKLVIISATSGDANTYLVQMGSEIAGVSSQLDGTDVNAVPAGADVALRLALDPVALTVTGFYSVNGAAEVEIGTQATTAAVFAGVDHDANAPTDPVSFAGVFASNRNSATSLNFSFDDFSIATAAVGTATLEADINIPTRGANGMAVALTVDLYAVGDLTPIYQFTPTADFAGLFSIDGIAPGTYEMAVKAVNTLQRVVAVTLVAGLNGPVLVPDLLAGDVNDDNSINILDLSAVVPSFDKLPGDPGYLPDADVNGDNAVNILDLSAIVPVFDTNGELPSTTPP